MTDHSLKNLSRNRFLFWCLFTVQVAGMLVILWFGLPVYWRLHSGRIDGATFPVFLVVGLTVVVMQWAYWLAYPLQRKLRFRRNVFVGHMLVWCGELSYFFPHALAALIVFDRYKELDEQKFVPERWLVLVAILFAVYCFKHQLESLGNAIIERDSEPTDSAPTSSKEIA